MRHDVDTHRFPAGPKEVEERFVSAALTLRRLPGEMTLTARSSANVMRARGMLPDRDDHPPRWPPTARAITEMEEALTWLAWLDDGDAKIVMLRADGWRWRQVEHRVGLSKATCCRRMAGAMVTIAEHLARGDKPRKTRCESRPGKAKAAPRRAIEPPAAQGDAATDQHSTAHDVPGAFRDDP
jgi:hypothetical protein